MGVSVGDLAAAEPLLRPLCAEIIRFGEVGAGTTYKLIVNLMGAVQIAATAEAILDRPLGLRIAVEAEMAHARRRDQIQGTVPRHRS